MKKIYLSLMGITITFGLSAQITLTQANSTPAIGDSFALISEATVLNVTHDGPNEIWDFSGVTGVTQSYSAISLANSQDPSSFPSATMVESYPTNEIYTFSSSTDFSQVGMYAPGQIRLINSDPRETLKFPLTFQTSFNETFLGDLTNIASGQTFERGGTVAIESDGYGDVILPYTTVTNVLRVKTTSNYTDIFQGISIADYEEVLYQWYDGNNHTYVAAYHELYINGSLNATTAIIMDQTTLVTSVPDINTTKSSKVSFFPNPAVESITIESSDNIKSIYIVDLKGQVVYTLNEVSNKQVINITDLNSGMYFIKYYVNDTSYTEKLIIK